jgi:hypothetical protein
MAKQITNLVVGVDAAVLKSLAVQSSMQWISERLRLGPWSFPSQKGMDENLPNLWSKLS